MLVNWLTLPMETVARIGSVWKGGGGGGIHAMQYLDEAKLGENVRNEVPAETTDGGGRLCGK